MFSTRAVMVPTVALTPPPDQAGANWLLRVTFLSLCASPSLFVSLSVSQRSTFGHSEALQCHFMPSNGCLSLIHHEANLQFPGTVRVRQQFVCIACLGLFYKNKTLLVGLLQFKSSIYGKSCGCWFFLSCQMESYQPRVCRKKAAAGNFCTVTEGW